MVMRRNLPDLEVPVLVCLSVILDQSEVVTLDVQSDFGL